MSYTPKQTSEMLKIPSSSLRRYANQFAEHLSESARRERGREYTEQDIALLARARELLRSNSPDDTNKLLAVMEDQPLEPDDTLALIPSISEALTTLTDAARSLRVEVDTLSERQTNSEAQITEARDRQSKTESELAEALARLEALEREQALPWYRKIIRRSGSD